MYRLVVILSFILILSPALASTSLLKNNVVVEKNNKFMGKFEKTYKTSPYNQIEQDFHKKFKLLDKK